ncbi:long-chain-fatty-acid--CoA ligase [Acinetobacter bereziniae]|jgi:long-chain acyl-CoA synthetase|uniref:long-chain-fatty-acid--CoA ligase n=1 Tax=Acinetobacter bereziniae TaxID=106648 RepID=UPI000C2B7403|nr:long-chain-fatty-acid--CoA ligase [Acinetobacter bereziniae]ATZ62036.1 long-chain fatty acid--CoA ligase [Acinetobacter bereziniae]MBJ8552071.1 long-chain-fatty-acid--CoA ligase [Acinetobacter bereziniae]MCU4315726.1 long-chain-fatty-acid--CoA ligase [Acinetobacter bereziniae]MCU4417303.1 long-chain-fatty-acid--CoA ligase [Acinetobacter bereziniae]MCU4434867.1 long-chain-fatty-acid--CoA ligase [Acinetobacter bereziniae]
MEKIWFAEYQKTGIPETVELPQENTSLIDIFERNFQKFGSRDAFIFMDKVMSFSDLELASRKFATYLQSLGLAKGARVAVMMPNVLQYPVVALAVFRAGLVLVNVNPLYTARELEHQLNDSGAEALVIVENFATVYQAIIGKTPVKHVVVASVGDMLGTLKGTLVNFVLRKVRKQIPDWNIPGHIKFNAALAKVSPSNYKRPNMTLSDTAVLQYTGGTTGVSKGAELTHRNLVANLMQCDGIFQSKFGQGDGAKDDRIFCALPLYHIFAFMVCALYGMYKGQANILIPNPRDLPAVIKELRKYQPGFFPAVNTLFNALVHNEEFRQLDFSNLKMAMGGGMAVLPSTAEEWKKVTGTIIIEGYGLSETSPVATANPPATTEFSGTIGVPLPLTDVAILDDDGNHLPQGEQGEISIRGPQVMKGYWNRPDETAKVMTADGYFRTGDIGVMDVRGYFKIVDRKKDMILVSGFNVYPSEIEEVIAQHPKVLEVAAIGVPDEKSGEVPKLFVVKKDPSLTTEEVLEFAKQNLTGYKRPRYVEFMDDLPKSNVGKILRKDLRK